MESKLNDCLSVLVLKAKLLVIFKQAEALRLVVASIEDQRASLLALHCKKDRHPFLGLLDLIRVDCIGEAETALALAQLAEGTEVRGAVSGTQLEIAAEGAITRFVSWLHDPTQGPTHAASA